MAGKLALKERGGRHPILIWAGCPILITWWQRLVPGAPAERIRSIGSNVGKWLSCARASFGPPIIPLCASSLHLRLSTVRHSLPSLYFSTLYVTHMNFILRVTYSCNNETSHYESTTKSLLNRYHCTKCIEIYSRNTNPSTPQSLEIITRHKLRVI